MRLEHFDQTLIFRPMLLQILQLVATGAKRRRGGAGSDVSSGLVGGCQSGASSSAPRMPLRPAYTVPMRVGC